MAFPIVAPSFLRDYIDLEHPEKNAGLVRYVITPQSVDYVLMLSNPLVAKRLIEQTDPLLFTMTYMSEADEAKFAENAKSLIAAYPTMQYYWQIRQMSMYILQQKGYNLAQKLLILNHTMSTVNGMVEQFQPNLIDGLAQNLTHATDFSEVLKFFDGVPVNPGVSLAEGVSFIKAMYNIAKDISPDGAVQKFKHFYDRIYKGLGISGPETFRMLDMKEYVKKRAHFGTDISDVRPNIMENIIINYLWALATPFTDPTVSIWDNFTFYISLYNALKVFITTIDPKDDDDLAAALSAFDLTLTDASSQNTFFPKIVSSLKNTNSGNNGDMAIITLS